RWNPNQRKKGISLFAMIRIFIALSLPLRVMRRAIIERIERDQKVFEAIQQRNDPFYGNFASTEHYPLLQPPYAFSNAYIRGWLAGSPWKKRNIEAYARRSEVGIYTLFNKEIVW